MVPPYHDHLGDILAVLDPEQFQNCFVSWVSALTGMPADVIAIDGKTSRRSCRKKGAKDVIHIVSAFASRQRLVLGQTKVVEKSNEIAAIPKPPDMLAIEGAIVTIDAMGCQRSTARNILDKNADYVLALKGDQSTLREDDVEVFFAEHKANGFKDVEISLYWVMDMVFRDDDCRVRKDHAPANFVTLKHMAHNLIRRAPGTDSLRMKRKVAAWNDEFLVSLVAA